MSKKIFASPLFRYVLIICFVTVSFLFSPKPHSPSEYCGNYFDLGKHAGFVINCDSYEYVRVSTNLSLLLEQNSLRQSRPLFLVLGTITGSLVYPVLKLFHLNIYQSYFGGYILLNFLFLLWSCYLFDTLLVKNTKLTALERSAFLVLFVSNDVIKTFFWTAHEQMFTFLTPLLCIQLLEYFSVNKSIPLKLILTVSFFCGLSLLIYGNFALFAICIWFALIYHRHSLRTIFVSGFLCCLPTFIWLSYLKINGITYYNHEIDHYHQFIWVIESLNNSIINFFKVSMNNFTGLINTLNANEMVLSLIVIILGIIGIKDGKDDNPVVVKCLFISALSIFFFFFLGFYQQRLTYTVFIPIFVVLAIYYDKKFELNRNLGVLLLIFGVASWHILNIVQYGPFN